MEGREINLNSAVKTAATKAEVHELIRNRWSPRSFSDRQITTTDLETILEAARWAASSYNEQPWRFIVASKGNSADYQKLLSLLVPFNQAWAKTAPVLLLMVAKKTFSRNNEPNNYALHDAGAALANLALQATALGLHVHGMAGFDHERARLELSIPDDYQVAAFAALGYAGDPNILPEGLKEQEIASRTRKPLSDLVFTASWGTPLPLKT